MDTASLSDRPYATPLFQCDGHQENGKCIAGRSENRIRWTDNEEGMPVYLVLCHRSALGQ